MRSSESDVATGFAAAEIRYGTGRPKIGAILLEMGALNESQVAAVLARQAQSNGELFGQAAISLGFTNLERVRRALEQQQRFQVLPAGDGSVDPLVVAAFNPSDPLSREARSLRAMISASRRADGSLPKSIALVGVDAAAETAILSANLGVACAQAGYRTLLVDTNIDQPVQHNLFRLSNRSGVSSMLSVDGDHRGMIQPSAVRGLSLITAGPAVPNTTELFDSKRLFVRLRLLSEGFDVLLIDASQSNGSMISFDGADAALIAVRQDRSSLDDMKKLACSISSSGTIILGSIIID
ncbi:hypothetical protein CLG96_07640 [Sphingomonas oleivorans]|uniref:Capsular biosynthesis protein n=1 Tax=Sphingomonas oleivorans TaxID=1735121 RepID=A0A2T5FZ00_9SPHN|nr:hypothetical protein CLG96_07640 [Sphingomonas oleivorans]